MASRESILAAVAKNQPDYLPLPEVPVFQAQIPDLVERFKTVAISVGSNVFEVTGLAQVKSYIQTGFGASPLVYSGVPELTGFENELKSGIADPIELGETEISVFPAHFGVAENGAVWITESVLKNRVLPFICQHLVVVLPIGHLYPLLNDAYHTIRKEEYGYGVFISGPSKTADIEQSLVLGAHGPRTMSIFLLVNQ